MQEKKLFFFENFTCNLLIDYCHQSSSDNLYAKLMINRTLKKTVLLAIQN